MDHTEVREILEDAAIEPEGLSRLMAGDTPTASLVAGHLAGCADCAEELERLRRSVGLIRPAVRAVPPAELRDRTLAYVAAVGRPRGAQVTGTGAVAAARGDRGRAPEELPGAGSGAATGPGPIALRRPSRLAPLLAMAAAIALALTGGAFVANSSRDGELKLQAAEIEALGDVARGTLRLDQQPDVRRVVLAGTGSGATAISGEMIYSVASAELVAVAEGLPPAAAGHEYRCWVEQDGVRTPIGKMFFGGSIAYWVGPVPTIATVGPSARFGVSLVELGGTGGLGDQVLSGSS